MQTRGVEERCSDREESKRRRGAQLRPGNNKRRGGAWLRQGNNKRRGGAWLRQGNKWRSVAPAGKQQEACRSEAPTGKQQEAWRSEARTGKQQKAWRSEAPTGIQKKAARWGGEGGGSGTSEENGSEHRADLVAEVHHAGIVAIGFFDQVTAASAHPGNAGLAEIGDQG